MKVVLVIVVTFVLFSFNTHHSEGTVSPAYKAAEAELFGSDEIFTITLRGDIRELLNDRSDKPAKHSLILSYRKTDSSELNIPVEMRTRGHFRKLKENCNYPPLMIHFGNDPSQTSSIFSGQSKLKLVMPCVKDDYVIREWLVYKIYNLVTPQSFRARLVQVKLEDTKTKKAPAPFYAILLEDEKHMAARNDAEVVEQKLRPRDTEPNPFLTMAVFEYLIGNTDWSVEYLQNIKLLKTGKSTRPVTVPYDFDHAGIVNAPYAHPAEELLMSSIQERRYRGYCVEDLKNFTNVIAQYNKLKNDIYGLYTTNRLLDAKYIKSTTKFLDDFYATINNSKAWQKAFSYPCDKNGTGNVVIKGLREE